TRRRESLRRVFASAYSARNCVGRASIILQNLQQSVCPFSNCPAVLGRWGNICAFLESLQGKTGNKPIGQGDGLFSQASPTAKLRLSGQTAKFSRSAQPGLHLLFPAIECGLLPTQSLEPLPPPQRKLFLDQ